MGKTYIVRGQWNCICPVCGFKKKSGEMRKRWDGVMVCKDDWEQRHPQDLIRATSDDTSVPFSLPEPTDTFSDVTVITQAQRDAL